MSWDDGPGNYCDDQGDGNSLGDTDGPHKLPGTTTLHKTRRDVEDLLVELEMAGHALSDVGELLGSTEYTTASKRKKDETLRSLQSVLTPEKLWPVMKLAPNASFLGLMELRIGQSVIVSLSLLH